MHDLAGCRAVLNLQSKNDEARQGDCHKCPEQRHDPQQTSMGTHAKQPTATKREHHRQSNRGKKEPYAVEALPKMPQPDAALQRPWATTTRQQRSEQSVDKSVDNSPHSHTIEEKKAPTVPRARASASGSGRAGHGGRNTYSKETVSQA